MEHTELCRLAEKYGTDKCPSIGHAYTPFYYDLFKDKRETVKKVVELGIGFPHGGNRKYFIPGASLFMWSEFFPNAHIYGIDYKPESLVDTSRIHSFLCDVRDKDALLAVMEKIGGDVDLFVDDGNHRLGDQLFVANTVMPLLKKDVIYAIEDVAYVRRLMRGLPDYNRWVAPIPTMRPEVETTLHHIMRDKLIVVQHK